MEFVAHGVQHRQLQMENEELDLNLDEIESDTNKKLQVKNRFEKLSEKVITVGKEKEVAEAKAKTEEEGRLQAEKERDFYRNFSQVSTKYPNVSEYQDQILERVNKGYDMEDAAVAVLAREGKLSPKPEPKPNVAGGSASTAVTDTEKSVDEMTQDERRQALQDLEKQGVNLLKL